MIGVWGATSGWGSDSAPPLVGPYGGGSLGSKSVSQALREAEMARSAGYKALRRGALGESADLIARAKANLDHVAVTKPELLNMPPGTSTAESVQFAFLVRMTNALIDEQAAAYDRLTSPRPSPTPAKPSEVHPAPTVVAPDPRVTSYPPNPKLPPEYGPPTVAASAGPLTPARMKVGLGVSLVVVLIGVYLLGRSKR